MKVANRKIIADFDAALQAGIQSGNVVGKFEKAKFAGEVPTFTGLLYRETALADSLTLTIPLGSFVAAGEILSVEVVPFDVTRPVDFTSTTGETDYFNNARTYAAYTFLVEPTADTVVTIPRALFNTGVHLIRYGIGQDKFTGNYTYSEPQLVIIDGVSPYDLPRVHPPAPVPPQNLPGPLDRTYIASQPGRRVMFTLPYDATKGREEGDYAEFKLGDSPFPIPIDSTSPETKYPISNDPAVAPTVPLSLDSIEAAPDGNYRFSYRLCDPANYCSKWSNVYVMTDVAQGPAPADFQAPLVDHAVPGDNIINRADMALEGGLRVLIPVYSNPQRSTPTDMYRVILTPTPSFPGSTATPVPLADRPLGNMAFPVPVLADPTQLATLYGNEVGNLPVVVSYAVIRGGTTYPVALTTTFNLDLNVIVVPGTVDGTDANVNLKEVVVQAERAPGVARTDNVLERGDVNLPAVGLITLWTVATLPVNATPFVVNFAYGGYTAERTILTPADLPANGVLEFPISWDTIRTLGGPQQIASYTVRRLNSNNQQQPQNATIVTVQSVFKQLNRPQVRKVTGTTVYCSSLTPLNTGVLTIYIPPSPLLDGATNGTLTLAGYRVPNPSGSAQASTNIPFLIPLGSATAGIEVTIPAPVAFFKQVQNSRTVTAASLRFSYSVTVPGGEVVNSDLADFRLNSIRSGPITSPLYCDGTPVPV